MRFFKIALIALVGVNSCMKNERALPLSEIRTGMSPSEVLLILGNPLSKQPVGNTEIWIYLLPPSVSKDLDEHAGGGVEICFDHEILTKIKMIPHLRR